MTDHEEALFVSLWGKFTSMRNLILIFVLMQISLGISSYASQQISFNNLTNMNDIPVKGNIKAPDFPANADLLWMNGLLYIVDSNNHVIRVYHPDSGQITTMKIGVKENQE